MTTSRFLIMAAGTGGHVLPALAVAQALQMRGVDVHWLGTPHGLENKLVDPTQIPMHTIRMRGLRGQSWIRFCYAPFELLRATYQAIKIIRRIQPQVVMSFGGFVCAPGGIASQLLRKRLVIHEQNAVAGMTNHYLSFFADKLFQAFPQTFPAKRQAITCGNPIRPAILDLPEPAVRFKDRSRTSPLKLFIFGGSQGADFLNQRIPEVIQRVAETQAVEIWHMVGKSEAIEVTRQKYTQHQIPCRVDEFVEDMAAAYAWGDVVISRAGALTVSEIAAAGIASILVPYPHAVDDHQTQNAQWLVNAGAAVLMPQAAFELRAWIQLLSEWGSDRALLLKMAEAAREVAYRSAVQVMMESLVFWRDCPD